MSIRHDDDLTPEQAWDEYADEQARAPAGNPFGDFLGLDDLDDPAGEQAGIYDDLDRFLGELFGEDHP